MTDTENLLQKAIEVLGGRDAAEHWMRQPVLALDGRKPIDLLSTPHGADLVEDHLARMEYGSMPFCMELDFQHANRPKWPSKSLRRHVWAARFFEISVPDAFKEHCFNGLLRLKYRFKPLLCSDVSFLA